MSEQLDAWRGEFGNAYTERNVVDPKARRLAFETMLGGMDVSSVLEVGCNRGHNLAALRTLLGGRARLLGLEPNKAARTVASGLGFAVRDGEISALPYGAGAFDLVFTAGVLIHISPDELDRALSEVHRTSRRYILSIEYSAPEETMVPYQDRDNLLWKRDYLAIWRARHPDLQPVRQGFWDVADGFDRCDWWLLEKE